MKISYKFANEAVEIEVEEKWGSVVIELDRQEKNHDRRETRRHESYSDDNNKRDTLANESADVEENVLEKFENIQLMYALEKLLPKQRELVQKTFFEGLSETEIAREMGVSQQAISKQFKVIYKNLKNFLN